MRPSVAAEQASLTASRRVAEIDGRLSRIVTVCGLKACKYHARLINELLDRRLVHTSMLDQLGRKP